MKHLENILCRYCDSADLQKNGKDRGKKQRDRCKHCKKNFILNYSYNACKKGVKEQIDKMLLNSSGIRDIGSLLNISKDTVTAHVKKTTKVNLNYSQRSSEIERKNLNFRTHIKRLNRKTICFSKNEKIHDKVISRSIEKYYFQGSVLNKNTA